MQLAVHLENGLRVYFTEARVQERAEAEPPRTTLTEYFSLNQSNSFARSLLYVDFTHGTRHERFGVAANVETKWHTRRTSLKPLQLNGFTLSVPDKGSATISVCCCMKCVVLLYVFDDLKRVPGEICPTFKRHAIDMDCLKMRTSTVWLWRKLPCLKYPHRSGPCMQSF